MNKRILWFDPSTVAFAYAFLNNGNLEDYNKFNPSLNISETNPTGNILNNIKLYIRNILNKFKPNIIGIEDIFSRNITDYKISSKVQGVIETVIYNYDCQITPLIYMARTVRAYYGLNITKVMTDEEYNKYIQKCIKNNKKPKARPKNHYRDLYPHINFDKYVNYRDSNNKKLKEFDYAKKIVIIDKVNKLYNLTLDYNDNDVADAIISANYINSLEMFEE